MRTIRTDVVRHPGHNLPPLPDDLQERYRAAAAAETDSGLTSGLRDTGLAIQGRVARQQRAKRRAQQRLLAVSALVVVGLVLVAFGWRSASDRRAATAPLGGTASAGVAPSEKLVLAQKKPWATVTSSAPATPGPTPVFASYKNLKLHLPVPVRSLTEIGFHQAAYRYALSMKSPLPDAKLSSARNRKGTGRDVATQPTGPDAVLVGSVLRMWRPRPGKPDTAVDVGAKPGRDVVAPVMGTVVKVKRYLLYGKWDDFEVHIQPDGYPNLDLVMIHIKDVSVAPGDRVVAGETRVAAIRKLSDKFYDQLSSYTKGGGDHVHMQVNDTTDSRYKGLVGAIDPNAFAGSAQNPTPTLESGVQ